MCANSCATSYLDRTQQFLSEDKATYGLVVRHSENASRDVEPNRNRPQATPLSSSNQTTLLIGRSPKSQCCRTSDARCSTSSDERRSYSVPDANSGTSTSGNFTNWWTK